MEANEYVKHLSIVGRWSPEMNKKYIHGTQETFNDNCDKDHNKPKMQVYSDEEEFVNAAAAGNLKKLLALKPNVSINSKNAKGQTALIASIIGGHLPAVKFLLAKQATVEIFDDTGNCALHHACLRDDVEIMKVLLDKMDPNYKNKTGETIFHLAVKNSKLQAFELLSQFTKIRINEQDGDGNTPVHIAIQKGNIKFLMKLLVLDTDLSLLNKDGMNPANLAVIQDDIECFKTLVESKHRISILCLKNQYNESNFHLAVRKGSMEIIDYLINLKIGRIITEDIDNKYGYTCLHWAVFQLNKELIGKILSINQKLINTRDLNELTVLEHIVNIFEKSKINQINVLDIAICLIRHDADIDLVKNRAGIRKIIKAIAMR